MTTTDQTIRDEHILLIQRDSIPGYFALPESRTDGADRRHFYAAFGSAE